MKHDMHMHPNFLKHPDMFDAFVQQAIRTGIKEICITEHMPLIGDDMHDRLPHNSVPTYTRSVREQSEKWKDKISIKVGIEMDYHPSTIPEIEAILSANHFDYVIGSTHLHVPRFHEIEKSGFQSIYTARNYQNILQCVKSGYFHTIAHINMYRWIYRNPTEYPLIDDHDTIENHSDVIEEILSEMKKKDMYLEVNTHLYESTHDERDIYPDVYIVRKALDCGVRGIFGSDAHKAESVGFAYDFVRSLSPYKELLSMGACD